MPRNIYIAEQWGDNFYAKLDTESPVDIETPWATTDNIAVVETLNNSSPIITIRFLDAVGIMVTGVYISPHKPFRLLLGKDSDSPMQMNIAVSTTKISEIQPGSTGNVHVETNFLLDNWFSMLTEKKSRAWKDTTYSNVVNDIAEEVGFESIDIEGTKGRFDVVQPYWTNYEMLQWLARHAVNTKGVPGYQMGVRADGSFFFKTYNRLFEQKPKRQIMVAPKDFDDTEDDDTDIGYNFSIVQDYGYMITRGASGVRSHHYNWFDKSFNENEVRVSDSDQSQLSDWFYIGKDHETGKSRVIDNGRMTDADAVAESHVIDVANDIQTLRVSVIGNMEYQIGDLVNMILVPGEEFEEQISRFYSGYYMIVSVSHQVHTRKRQFVTELRLQRQGPDVKEISDLVSSQAGKSLKPIR